jgi:hypothetical protein
MFDTLYLPADQAKFGELGASIKLKLSKSSENYCTLKFNLNDGTYIKGNPELENQLNGPDWVQKWLHQRLKVGVQFDIEI